MFRIEQLCVILFWRMFECMEDWAEQRMLDSIHQQTIRPTAPLSRPLSLAIINHMPPFVIPNSHSDKICSVTEKLKRVICCEYSLLLQNFSCNQWPWPLVMTKIMTAIRTWPWSMNNDHTTHQPPEMIKRIAKHFDVSLTWQFHTHSQFDNSLSLSCIFWKRKHSF